MSDQARSNEKGAKQQESNPASAPTISLPKGGGAIRGIGEKFSVNPVTGTGSLTVPIFTSPGRSDFYPKLSLSYDSGSGNGPFGLGWHLSIPTVTRKTDKGLPRYNDAGESDTFILSDAEDLVPVLLPVLKQDGTVSQWKRERPQRTESALGKSWNIYRYRPRIEGLFARIEHWRAQDRTESHWRVTTKDNITSIYGLRREARIGDPSDDSRIFKWFLQLTYDDRGNVIVYTYRPENKDNVEVSLPYEKNRFSDGNPNFSHTYLKRIQYGNIAPQSASGTNVILSWPTNVHRLPRHCILKP